MSQSFLQWSLTCFTTRLFSQSQGKFEIFTDNLELTFDNIFETNPFLVIAREGFNAILTQWYKNDKPTTQGTEIANLTS